MVHDAGEMLDSVYRNNLFLVRLDAEGSWYRYYHGFSEAVAQSLQVRTPDLPGAIRRKAALWFIRNGCVEYAFESAFYSDDFEFVTRYAFLHSHLLVTR